MNAPVKPPAETLPVWNLEDLYAGRDDPRRPAERAPKNGAEIATKGKSARTAEHVSILHLGKTSALAGG